MNIMIKCSFTSNQVSQQFEKNYPITLKELNFFKKKRQKNGFKCCIVKKEEGLNKS